MAQGGNKTTDLGPSTIDGVAVEGYAVHLDAATLKADIANENLPSWMQDAVASVSNPNVDYKVYVDGSGRLVRLTTKTTVTVSGVAVSEGTSLDFSDYGADVNVSAPPAGDVLSFQSFLQQARIPLRLIRHGDSLHRRSRLVGTGRSDPASHDRVRCVPSSSGGGRCGAHGGIMKAGDEHHLRRPYH